SSLTAPEPSPVSSMSRRARRSRPHGFAKTRTRMINRRRLLRIGITVGLVAITLTLRPTEASLSDAPARQQQTAERGPPPGLESYVGDYLYPDGATFKLRRDGDTLYQEAPGRRLALAAVSETLFMMGPVFTAEFVTDTRGGVTIILSDGAGVEY